MTVKVVHYDKITDELLEGAWTLYEAAFRDLNTRTVQRHMMTAEEFDQMMTDWRWTKCVAFGETRGPVGLATYTNHLEAHPLISQDYFATHHPDKFLAQRIWWVGFVAVAEDARGTEVFQKLIESLYWLSGDDAITGIDYAKVNITRGLPSAAARYLQGVTEPRGRAVTMEQIDYQGFYLHEYPPTL